MKLKSAIVLIALACSIQVFAQSKASKERVKKAANLTQSADDKAIRARMDAVWAAWSTLDVKNAAKFYSKDPGLVFYDITPLKYNGWSEYENGVQKVLQSFKSAKLTVNNDAKVWTRGNGALGTATVHADLVRQDGKSESADWRWTVVYEKQQGEWMIVHEHISAPLP